MKHNPGWQQAQDVLLTRHPAYMAHLRTTKNYRSICWEISNLLQVECNFNKYFDTG
jgi:hypothetical protein